LQVDYLRSSYGIADPPVQKEDPPQSNARRRPKTLFVTILVRLTALHTTLAAVRAAFTALLANETTA